ncbi:MAG: DUF2259 domain-containing protein [Termitinemataceae bacterium]|nr:MAG: DUF2259 domain-containing protein [Termitinemataceae bacterium]
MLLKRARFLCAIFFILANASLNAGDVAVFSDLGFSQNGSVYMFGQYGVTEHSLIPWADLNIINVETNDFVNGGRFSYKHHEKIDAGQDGQGALLRLISKNSNFLKNYQSTFMKQGVPLFVSLKNGHNRDGETIDFRDFDFGTYYSAALIPQTHGKGKSSSSSFYILLDLTNKDGTKKTIRLGDPDVKRYGVSSYTIKKIMVNENRTSMIFVIEMTLPTTDGPNIRYMVEALSLRP